MPRKSAQPDYYDLIGAAASKAIDKLGSAEKARDSAMRWLENNRDAPVGHRETIYQVYQMLDLAVMIGWA